MIIEHDVLPKDLHNARQHLRCCWTCLLKADTAYKEGNLEVVEKRMEEFNRSLRELENLADRKIRRDRLELTIQELRNKGVKIDFASREAFA